ncbi:MAG TPA: glycerol-3-phosphate 1-O-acyltransferase PlsY [Candidatus Angelobacter sp.]|nr:glycerol-3-phosphate 1-O-acyltransferase PlsY [Candidatus Angelobacter sp.]
MLTLYLIIAIIAYLLGSIPFGYVLVRVFRGEDIRLTGSGNIGATNVARSGAKGLGAATLLLDALKGLVAVWIASRLAAGEPSALPYMSAAALAAVLGHMFPVWLGFKGGKGVATALGVFILLFPKALLVSLAIFILIVAATRYVSLGSILAAIAFPIAGYLIDHANWQALLPVWVVVALIVMKHHQNIRRLLAGNEHRFGSSKTAVPEKQA